MLTIFCFNILNEKQDKMYLKIKKKSSLYDLRKSLEDKRYFNSLYFLNSNKNYIKQEEEKNISVEEFDKNIIYFTDVNYIKVNLGGEFLCNIDFKNIPLSKLRIELDKEINQNDKFFFNDAFILDEENFTVFEICQNNVIEMNRISDNIFNKLKKDVIINKEINTLKENNNKSAENINNIPNKEIKESENIFIEDKNEIEELIPNHHINILNKRDEKDHNNNIKKNKSYNSEKKGKKKYKAIFDNNMEDNFEFECSPNDTLKKIREYLPSKINNYNFLFDGYPILQEDDVKVSEIAKNNTIYLKRKDFSNLDYLQKIEKNSIYEYYLYKNEKFVEEEEKKCISILLVGETGVGKTTFLNSFINFILKVNYSDNFRYLLVNEADSKCKSQTKTVNIYHIKSHNSYPPIKIIDTPGFGDTSGIEFDKKIAKMIFEKFKEIKELSSVCIICKYNEGRFDYSQRYIYNFIINLFGKDMAENFMILFSFCDVGEVLSKQIFEEKNSPFYQIISRIKEPWYLKFNNSGFFSEKQNNIIEEFFKMGMESYMALLNKLKTLKKIKLEISYEVNVKREKCDNITSYIARKINELARLICNSSNKCTDKSLNIYYCSKCNFFSDSNNCVVCNNIIELDYGKKKFNFKVKKINNLTLKSYFEIYCNLFQLEKIMIEYNYITLKGSQETIKDFLQICIENEKNSKNIQQQIIHIITNYEKYRNKFDNLQKEPKEDFTFFIFNNFIGVNN